MADNMRSYPPYCVCMLGTLKEGLINYYLSSICMLDESLGDMLGDDVPPATVWDCAQLCSPGPSATCGGNLTLQPSESRAVTSETLSGYHISCWAHQLTSPASKAAPADALWPVVAAVARRGLVSARLQEMICGRQAYVRRPCTVALAPQSGGCGRYDEGR